MFDAAATFRRSALALVLVPLVVGCDEESVIVQTPTSPARVVISPSEITLGFIGDTGQLSAAVTLTDGTTGTGFSVAWSSVTPSVATVDGNGLVTAVGEGTTTIIAQVLNLADTATVSVVRIPTSLSISPDSVLLVTVGATAAITPTVTDGGGQALPASVVSWQSSDPAVATVDGSGTVTAVADGTTTIQATAGTASASASVRVATGPASITVSPTAVELRDAGDTATVSATVRNVIDDVIESPVTWSSGDATVVTVSAAGLLTAVAAGQTTVTATTMGGLSAAVAVTVVQTPVSIDITPATETTAAGGQVQFVLIAEDAAGLLIPNPDATWTSSDTTVATVDSTGLATGVTDGVASIIATVPNSDSTMLTDTATLTVRTVVVDSLDVFPDVSVLRIGESAILTARFFDSDGREVGSAPVTWATRDAAIVSVSNTGGITGLAAGSSWVVATSGSASDSTAVTVSADTASVPPGEFDVNIRYVGAAPSQSRLDLFTAVEGVWENVVRGDQSDAVVNLGSGACGIPHPAVSEAIDDVVVFVEITNIDGAGGTLSQVGPCVVRTSNGLPMVSTLRIDEADFAALEASGDIATQLRREMGWALGYGTSAAWTFALVGGGTVNPYFPGTEAVARFTAAGFAAEFPVPVENVGASGIRDATWRETILDTELMAGPLDLGVANPLSAITIGAMQDLGYEVNFEAAETFPPPPNPALRAAVHLDLDVTLHAPRYEADSSGRLRRIPRR